MSIQFTAMTIVTLVTGVLTFYHDDRLHYLISDPFRVIFTKKGHIPHAVIFCMSLIVYLGTSVIYLAEYKSQSRFTKSIVRFINQFKYQHDVFRLNMDNEHKLVLRVNILYKFYMKFLGNLFSVSVSVMYIFISSFAFYYHGDQYNIVILIINVILFITFANHATISALSMAFWFYVPISFLNFKLDELARSLRVSIRWRKYKVIHSEQLVYDKLTKVVKILSLTYNLYIGLIYVIMPYVITIDIKLIVLLNDNVMIDNPIVHFIMNLISLALLAAAFINIYLVNYISASITIRNNTLVKYLYPLFNGNHSTNLKLKLKIDSFIARLNKQYIGFRCFNLFKFTKLVFYEYWLGLSSSYILIHDFLK